MVCPISSRALYRSKRLSPDPAERAYIIKRTSSWFPDRPHTDLAKRPGHRHFGCCRYYQILLFGTVHPRRRPTREYAPQYRPLFPFLSDGTAKQHDGPTRQTPTTHYPISKRQATILSATPCAGPTPTHRLCFPIISAPTQFLIFPPRTKSAATRPTDATPDGLSVASPLRSIQPQYLKLDP